MAASKTYLGMVNEVLKELRETPVSTVNYTTYSTLVGKWVNDAKRQIEDAWEWEPLNYKIDFLLSYGQQDYDLTQMFPPLNARARLRQNPYQINRPMAFDVTALNPFNLIEMEPDWIRQTRDKMPNLQLQVAPINFGLERYNNGTNDGINMVLWEYPTIARSWRLYFTNPQDDLALDTDPVYCPWVPIVALATDIALNERGEEIGEPGTTIDQRAHIHISNAIGVDATFQRSKLDFRPD